MDFEFPDENGKPYKSSGGKMVWNEELEKEIPEGWTLGKMEDLVIIEMGQSPKGDTYNIEGIGTALINGPVEFGNYFTKKVKWTTSPTKLSSKGDLIICVRGSTTGRFVKSDGEYCLGRGVCSFRAKSSQCYTDQVFKNNIDSLLSLTTGSTFPNWDRKTLSSFPVVIPKSNVTEHFEQTVSNISNKADYASMENIKLTEIKELISAKMTKVEHQKEIA